MSPALNLFFAFTAIFALFCGNCGEPPCGDPPPGSTGCQATFFPTNNVRTRWDNLRGGVVVEWGWRGATPGTYQVYRCDSRVSDCRYWSGYQAINNWGGSTHLDKNVYRGVTYYYGVKNRYQPCGEYWSENTSYITVP